MNVQNVYFLDNIEFIQKSFCQQQHLFENAKTDCGNWKHVKEYF